MKVIVVLLTHIDNLPPARNLLLCLNQKNIDIELITMYSEFLPDEIKKSNKFKIHDVQPKVEYNKIKCLINRFYRRYKVRNLIQKIASNEDIVWTVTDYDAMECGKILLNYNHIMQLMELIEDIPIFDELPMLKANIKKYAKRAKCVVVPEYNRAYIQQVIWDLKDTPIILPNKPYTNYTQRNMEIKNKHAKEVIERIKNKKIIIYQGVFGFERVLNQFIEAVDKLGEEYCILLMGRDDEELKKLKLKYNNINFIPFLPAPEHLSVTSYAYIGILSYVNSNNIRHYMPLNSIYCAPNKIYEYAAFGIPMIGNNIPGLNTPFSKYNIGKCAENLTVDEICRAIKEIEANYKDMSDNCIKFYSDINYNNIVDQILYEFYRN